MILYNFFAKIHRELYAKGIFKKIRLGKKVIGVGNLTFGGTGKTPFVRDLTEKLIQLGLKPAIVVRNYKGSSEVSAVMDKEKANHPEIWGDEACWYFQHVKVPIYSGPLKWKSALLADTNSEINTLVIDDGFQHHKLSQDESFVLIDAVRGVRELKKRSREDISALKKAQAVVITRTNQVTPEELESLKFYLDYSGPLFLNRTNFINLKNWQGNKIEISRMRIGLVSGIGNTESFKRLFESQFKGVFFLTYDFPDHHGFHPIDIDKIEQFRLQNKLDLIITTEKDETKLRRLGSDFSHWAVLSVESKMQDEREWSEFLRNLIL